MKSLKKAIISFLKGFKYAYDGIIYNIKGERNMRVHICIMILVIAFGLVFNISKFEWIICIILFGLVLDPLLGIFTIFLGSLIALPISIFILYKEKNNMIPFGPFLLLAFMLIYYSGITSEQIINLLI